MSFAVRAIGLINAALDVLGFNNTGNINLETLGEQVSSTVTINSNGVISYAGTTIGSLAPTAWKSPTGSAGNYEIRAELTLIDVGPSGQVLVFGDDLSFETAPYDTGWRPHTSGTKLLICEMLSNNTGITIEGSLSIRNATTLETISRNFRIRAATGN